MQMENKTVRLRRLKVEGITHPFIAAVASCLWVSTCINHPAESFARIDPPEGAESVRSQSPATNNPFGNIVEMFGGARHVTVAGQPAATAQEYLIDTMPTRFRNIANPGFANAKALLKKTLPPKITPAMVKPAYRRPISLTIGCEPLGGVTSELSRVANLCLA